LLCKIELLTNIYRCCIILLSIC